jgi:DNA-binding Xre family transcriptional regulator
MPAFIITSVTFTSIQFSDELLHFSILFLAIPISLYALLSGKRNHNNNLIFIIGVSGLTVLFLALFSEGNFFGVPLETLLTIIGSMIVISAHYKNYQICQQLDCDCHK